jgi:periplasmic divalent cation tolerance protein
VRPAPRRLQTSADYPARGVGHCASPAAPAKPAATIAIITPALRLSTVPMPCLAVVTTVAARADAERLARAMVERGLAACAQISPIDSFYIWNGELCHEPELRVLFKTVTARWDELRQAIRAAHPYELPAIHAIALEPIDEAYAAWVEQQAGGVPPAAPR